MLCSSPSPLALPSIACFSENDSHCCSCTAMAYESSPSITSDDSDFEFGSPDSCIYGQDPPVSPRLRCSAWEFSAQPSPSHVFYAPAPADFVINAPHRQPPAFMSLQESSAFIPPARVRYASVADGAAAAEASKSHSEDAIDAAPARRKNLKSLMLQRRELDQLPPLAGARSATVPQRNSRTAMAIGSPSSYSATPSPSSKRSSSPASGTKSRRWSFGLDFLHSKRSSPENINALNDRQYAGDANNYQDAYLTVDSNYAISDSPRQSTSSATKPDHRCELESGRQAVASASPSRAAAAIQGRPAPQLQSAGYGHPAPPSPMSPHAQHYQQQRARAQELGRKTNLPYRQNFLGSCFFPSSQVASH